MTDTPTNPGPASSGPASSPPAPTPLPWELVQAEWERHRRWVAAILIAHKPRWADVDDLLQEVALAFLKHVGEIRDSGAVRPWLRTVAINAARLAARSGKLRERGTGGDSLGPDASPASYSPDAAQAAEVSEEARAIMSLAMNLDEGYREPLLLRCVQELSYREIGEILGLPETTVETRIARGRRMLREAATRAAESKTSSAPALKLAGP